MQHTHSIWSIVIVEFLLYYYCYYCNCYYHYLFYFTLSLSHSLGRSLLALIRICLRLAESRYTVHGPIQCSIGVQNVVYSLIVRELFRVWVRIRTAARERCISVPCHTAAFSANTSFEPYVVLKSRVLNITIYKFISIHNVCVCVDMIV